MSVGQYSTTARCIGSKDLHIHLRKLSEQVVQGTHSVSLKFEFQNYDEKKSNLNISLKYRDISDETLLVKLTNPYGRDVIEEIKEYLFPECIV